MRMANSVDRDQTAPKEQSDLGMHCFDRHFCPTLLGRYAITECIV